MKIEICFTYNSTLPITKELPSIVIDLPYRLNDGDLIYLEHFITEEDEKRFTPEQLDFLRDDGCFEVESLSWQNGNKKDGIWQVAYMCY